MNKRRIIAGLLAAASIAAGVAVAPAFGAPDERRAMSASKRSAGGRAPGSFTPSAADPRLAALFARGGLDAGQRFRFTPAEAKNSRAVTVAVRARGARSVADRTAPAAVPATVGLAPIAYNLGVSLGWRRFALSGDVAKVDLPAQGTGRESAELGVSYSLPRFSTRVKAGADRATGAGPQVAEGDRSYSLDVGGSYSLTRNLDVTAGVRYRSDRDRLTRLDDRRDSQAVYVGTAFRF